MKLLCLFCFYDISISRITILSFLSIKVYSYTVVRFKYLKRSIFFNFIVVKSIIIH
ncbi:hypothetical protein BJ944DRAFT_261709, partial [Cunninghamella echinulata]